MSSMEHVVLWEAAAAEKESLFQRVNIPLGRRGRLVAVAAALVLLPVAGFAGFVSDSLVTTFTITASAGENMELVVADGVLCSTFAGSGSCVVDSFDLQGNVVLTISGSTDSDVYRLSYTAVNAGSSTLEACGLAFVGASPDTLSVAYSPISNLVVGTQLIPTDTSFSSIELSLAGAVQPIVPSEVVGPVTLTADFQLVAGC